MSDSAVPAGAPALRKRASNLAVYVLWPFAIVWNATVGGIGAFIYFHQPDHPRTLLIVIGVFALAGLLLIWLAIHVTANAVRFRGSEIDLQSPGILGGRLNGIVRVPQRALGWSPLRFRVTHWRPGTSDSRDDLLWETAEPVQAPGGGAGGAAALPFSIRLPYDCKPSVEPGVLRNYVWRLELETAKGSVSFDVPVERSAQGSAEQTMAALRPVIRNAPPNAVATIERHLNSVDIRFPMPSWTWSWYSIVVITTVAAFVIAHFVLKRYSAEGMPPMVAVWTYLAIGAATLFFGGFPLLSLALTVRSVYADRAAVKITYAWPMRKPAQVAASELKDVTSEYSNGSMNYTISIVRADGKPMIGSLMSAKTREEGEWIAGELRRALFGS